MQVSAQAPSSRPDIATAARAQTPELPGELWIHIFELVYDTTPPHLRDVTLPLTLTWVSKRWRRLACNTPNLWRTIVATPWQSISSAGLIEAYSKAAERANNSHIHLVVLMCSECDPHSRPNGRSQSQTFVSDLGDILARWQIESEMITSVTIKMETSGNHELGSWALALANVTEIMVYSCVDDPEDPTHFSGSWLRLFPALQSLELRDVSLPSLWEIGQTLTVQNLVLQGGYYDPGDLVYVLGIWHFLERFRLSWVHRLDDTPMRAKENSVHSSLKELSFDCYFVQDPLLHLAGVTFPNLQLLELVGYLREPIREDSPLCTVADWETCLRQILVGCQHSPSLRRLRFHIFDGTQDHDEAEARIAALRPLANVEGLDIEGVCNRFAVEHLSAALCSSDPLFRMLSVLRFCSTPHVPFPSILELVATRRQLAAASPGLVSPISRVVFENCGALPLDAQRQLDAALRLEDGRL